MKRRIRLKRKIKMPKIEFKKWTFFRKILVIFFLLILLLFIIFRYINTKVSPLISNYAVLEAKNISSFILNKAISKNISSILNREELFIISKDNNNEINTIDFNPIVVNKVLSEVTEIIHSSLKKLEEGKTDDLELPESSYLSNYLKRKEGIIFEIPSGIVFDNALLANLGPKIPVRLSFVGDITSSIDTNVTNYGINNALIEINLYLKVTEKVILPVTVDQVDVELTIPVALKLIQGNIPNYYLNGLSGSSSVLTVPVE